MSRDRKWLQAITKVADTYGATVGVTKRGHLRVAHPSGWAAIVPSTGASYRGLKNSINQIHRVARRETR